MKVDICHSQRTPHPLLSKDWAYLYCFVHFRSPIVPGGYSLSDSIERKRERERERERERKRNIIVNKNTTFSIMNTDGRTIVDFDFESRDDKLNKLKNTSK